MTLASSLHGDGGLRVMTIAPSKVRCVWIQDLWTGLGTGDESGGKGRDYLKVH